tara:strand:- start:1381 stop:1518 length:138 start_codon:yes stop_codon:yes gene_type:complete
MAGAPGIEPGNGGIKNRCLTAWLSPKINFVYHNKKNYIVFDVIHQ